MTLALKKILITGGTRGIGRALAEALTLEGAEVMVCGRNRDAVAATERELGVRGVTCDVATEAGRGRLVQAIRGEVSGLDVLVNNAGVQYDHDVVAGIDLAKAEQEISLNVLAPIALTHALLPLLLSSPDAAIVNVSSALGMAPSPRAPVYSAAKAAVTAWTHALRAQLEELEVRVLEVVPPLVATDMTAGRDSGAASPEQVARAIVRGLARRRNRIVIGKARLLDTIHRVSPALARRTMRDR